MGPLFSFTVQNFDNPDQLSANSPNRGTRDRSCPISGLLIDQLIEAGILVGIFHQKPLAGLKHISCNSRVVENPDLSLQSSHSDPAV